jgi:hypothetical protein
MEKAWACWLAFQLREHKPQEWQARGREREFFSSTYFATKS